jgi:hypothetical protein
MIVLIRMLAINILLMGCVKEKIEIRSPVPGQQAYPGKYEE